MSGTYSHLLPDLLPNTEHGLSFVHACEAKIGYDFKQPLLLWEALQADGANPVLLAPRLFPQGHKRLAIIGDKLLDILLATKWYPTMQVTGIYDRFRQDKTSNENLAAIFDQVQLEQFVSFAPGTITAPAKAKTAAVEGIIGAVFLDASSKEPSAGITAAKQVAETLGIEVFPDVSTLAALRVAQVSSA
ncbi:MAG: hypothetical protein Q9174_005603 [Haloplaca sp. 1 TL-2023]